MHYKPIKSIISFTLAALLSFQKGKFNFQVREYLKIAVQNKYILNLRQNSVFLCQGKPILAPIGFKRNSNLLDSRKMQNRK